MMDGWTGGKQSQTKKDQLGRYTAAAEAREHNGLDNVDKAVVGERSRENYERLERYNRKELCV